MPLSGKVALITGAGGGLGRGIAQAFARAGAQVVVSDIDEATLQATAQTLQDFGTPCLALPCDVSQGEAVERLFAQVQQHGRSPDILVNNAARVPNSPAESERRNRHYAHVTQAVPRGALGITTSLSDDDWLKWWDVNVHGAFYCTRAALRHMQPRRSGQIVNIASVAGLGPYSMHSPGYSASKAALISLTQTVAYDVAGAQIGVNAIACGGVMTPAFQTYLDACSHAQREQLMQMVPMGRLGEPDEYARLAVFLAAGQHYLIGQVISPNGGLVI